MTADEELKWARGEIARLNALLPPNPGPGQRWRQGTKVGRNVYIHVGDAPVGYPAGQMASDEIAAVVCEAVNAFTTRQPTDRAPAPRLDALLVVCPGCLADPGDPCYSTSSDEPRPRPHKLRRLAAAKALTQCGHCRGLGWVPEEAS
jgi:hypothetical protein